MIGTQIKILLNTANPGSFPKTKPLNRKWVTGSMLTVTTHFLKTRSLSCFLSLGRERTLLVLGDSCCIYRRSVRASSVVCLISPSCLSLRRNSWAVASSFASFCHFTAGTATEMSATLILCLAGLLGVS